MPVFGDSVLRPHHLGRGCRELKTGLASIMKITPFQPCSSRTEHKWWNWFWKTNKTPFEIYPLQWSDLWNCTQHCPCTTGYSSVCSWWEPRIVMEVHNLCLQVLFYFFSPWKEEQTGSLNPLWDMGSPFYSKWVVMHWTHPSLLTATKCKVCHYAGRLWHLYSILQESSELYSYSEIQKWKWTYAVLTALGY